MSDSIGAAVGENGKNDPEDVRHVYALLNEILTKKLTVSDRVSPEMIKAIKKFQQPSMPKPDGKIDPAGTTWKRLVIAAGRLGKGTSLVLSFDDGPGPKEALAGILGTLLTKSIRAEFYVLGAEVDQYPALARSIVKAGHKIQNHSYSHPDLAKAKKRVVRMELQKTQESIKKITGVTATKVRPPYGAGGWPGNHDPELADVAAKLSLAIQNWDIDTLDWGAPRGLGLTKLSAIENQLWEKRSRKTLNVLMHVKKETARDLQGFISQLKQWGFAFANP